MIKPFIRDEHGGFICVHFIDSDERNRWGVSRDWKVAGEYTLDKVANSMATDRCPSDRNTTEKKITNFLAELVVEAAMERDQKVLRCRSYALVEAFGSPYLLIEATRADGAVRNLSALPVSSVAEANKMIDAVEADLGFGTARYECDGAGEAYTMIPVPDDGSLPAGDEIRSGVPMSFGYAFAKILDDAEMRAELLAALRSRGQGRSLHAH